jgi:hypothetical protein
MQLLDQYDEYLRGGEASDAVADSYGEVQIPAAAPRRRRSEGVAGAAPRGAYSTSANRPRHARHLARAALARCARSSGKSDVGAGDDRGGEHARSA